MKGILTLALIVICAFLNLGIAYLSGTKSSRVMSTVFLWWFPAIILNGAVTRTFGDLGVGLVSCLSICIVVLSFLHLRAHKGGRLEDT